MLDKLCYHLKSHWLVDRMSGHSTLSVEMVHWCSQVEISNEYFERILWIIALQGSIWTKNWTQIFESFKNVYTFTIFRVLFQRNLGNLKKELKEEFLPCKWNDFLWNFPAERILKVFKSRVSLKFSIWRERFRLQIRVDMLRPSTNWSMRLASNYGRNVKIFDDCTITHRAPSSIIAPIVCKVCIRNSYTNAAQLDHRTLTRSSLVYIVDVPLLRKILINRLKRAR